jgi:ribonucleoside-diphosphate reductase alpha chain
MIVSKLEVLEFNDYKQKLIEDVGLASIYEDYSIDTYYLDNELAKSVIRSKYIAPEDKENLLEFWARIALGTAKAEYIDIIRNVKTQNELEIKKSVIKELLQDKDISKIILFDTTSIEEFARSYEYFWAKKFMEILVDFKFVPGGRINNAVGRQISTPISAFNCYFIPFTKTDGKGADSLEAIYDCIKKTGLTYASQGGVGNNISVLRPRGAPLRDSTESPGSISFMDLISINTNSIAQNGRRGANMQIISVWHPDVEHFIDIKNDKFAEYVQEFAKYDHETSKKLSIEYSDRRKVSYSNISVLLNSEFMNAVINNNNFELVFPDYEKSGRDVYNNEWDGDIYKWKQAGYPVKIYRTIDARKLWNKIIHAAWRSAEPGIIFEDEIRHNWTISSPFHGVNPCAEIVLSDNEPCDLGHVALDRFVKSDQTFDIKKYIETIHIATRFLDNIHTINEDLHALPEQKQASINFRRLGLGITGLGDMFIRRGIMYDSEEALTTSEELAKLLLRESNYLSIQLAKEKGFYPSFDKKDYLKAEIVQKLFDTDAELRDQFIPNGIRNCAVNTIAPVGSGSIIAQCSSGIEPLYALRYERKVKRNSGEGYDIFVTYERVIRELFGTDIDIPDFAKRTAHKVSPSFRIKLQAVWQKYVMNSISSTVNLAEDVSEDVISNLYIDAYNHKLKGLTVYREGSRAGILTTFTDKTNLALEELKFISDRQRRLIERLIQEGQEQSVKGVLATYGVEFGFVNGEKPVYPENWDIPRRPTHLPGYTVKRTAEGKKWYITLNFDMYHELYEVFATTNDKDKDVDIKPALENLINLLYSSNIEKNLITKQLLRSQHQHIIDHTMRMLSLGLRHKIPLESLVECFDIPGQNVTHFTYHIMKILAERLPDGTKSKSECPECEQHGSMVYTNGCNTCSNCGYTKC